MVKNMTVGEVKKMYAGEYVELEVYRARERGEYYPREFHTDNCYSLNDSEYSNEDEVGLCDLMGEEEYEHSILANVSDKADFTDWYGDKDAKVLCIMLAD